MRGFILADGALTPADYTPAQRKHHRTTGPGIHITGRDADSVRRCLSRYFQEDK